MKVILKADWFVEGQRYRRSQSSRDLVEVPGRLRKKLPKSAKIVDEAEPEEPKPDESPAALATKAFKEAAHASDGDELPGDDGSGALAKAREVLAQGDKKPAKGGKK